MVYNKTMDNANVCQDCNGLCSVCVYMKEIKE